MRLLRDWDDLPQYMQNEAVRPYYDALSSRKVGLFFKRAFDLVAGLLLLIVIALPLLVIGVWIKIDSKGPAFFRQRRVTQYGREFRIYKFRTMTVNAEQQGSQVTIQNDSRITRAGKALRKRRLDELPQVLNVIVGDMSFVGPRPEVPKYVADYTDEMMATLLMPAGVTSECSILYRDEEKTLKGAKDVDSAYIHDVMPGKMVYNLKEINDFSFLNDIRILWRTAVHVLFSKGEKGDG